MRDYMTDGRIIVRKYRASDVFALYEAVNESIAELTRWGFYHTGFTLDDAAEDVARRIADWDAGNNYTFLIEALPARIFIGNCRVEELELERHHAGLGWWVRTGKTRRGMATAAARLVARAAFEDLQLHTLGVYTNADNHASRRVAAKLGAVLVELKPEADGVICAVHEVRPEDLRSV